MNTYVCQHCSSNLDKGDIFKHFMSVYNDNRKAMEAAVLYGWSETEKKHFNRSIIVQPEHSSQYTICPDCKKKDPLKINFY
jgi:hypothetical protein